MTRGAHTACTTITAARVLALSFSKLKRTVPCICGALLVCTPAHLAGMLAPDGRCKTLDAAADGYVRAEAVGAMVLAAVADSGALAAMGRAPLALLAGSAVNQDGRSSALTAPNGPAQQVGALYYIYFAHYYFPATCRCLVVRSKRQLLFGAAVPYEASTQAPTSQAAQAGPHTSGSGPQHSHNVYCISAVN